MDARASYFGESRRALSYPDAARPYMSYPDPQDSQSTTSPYYTEQQQGPRNMQNLSSNIGPTHPHVYPETLDAMNVFDFGHITIPHVPTGATLGAVQSTTAGLGHGHNGGWNSGYGYNTYYSPSVVIHEDVQATPPPWGHSYNGNWDARYSYNARNSRTGANLETVQSPITTFGYGPNGNWDDAYGFHTHNGYTPRRTQVPSVANVGQLTAAIDMPLGGNLNDTFPTDGLDIEGADTFQNHLASYPAASAMWRREREPTTYHAQSTDQAPVAVGGYMNKSPTGSLLKNNLRNENSDEPTQERYGSEDSTYEPPNKVEGTKRRRGATDTGREPDDDGEDSSDGPQAEVVATSSRRKAGTRRNKKRKAAVDPKDDQGKAEGDPWLEGLAPNANGLYFPSLSDAHEFYAQTERWSPPKLRRPLSQAKRVSMIIQLRTAILNMSGIRDNNNRHLKRWINGNYQAPAAEIIAFRIMESLEYLHKKGYREPILDPTRLDESKWEMNLTFNERFDKILEVLSVSKSTCKALLDGANIMHLVAGPGVKDRMVKSNQRGNNRKADVFAARHENLKKAGNADPANDATGGSVDGLLEAASDGATGASITIGQEASPHAGVKAFGEGPQNATEAGPSEEPSRKRRRISTRAIVHESSSEGIIAVPEEARMPMRQQRLREVFRGIHNSPDRDTDEDVGPSTAQSASLVRLSEHSLDVNTASYHRPGKDEAPTSQTQAATRVTRSRTKATPATKGKGKTRAT